MFPRSKPIINGIEWPKSYCFAPLRPSRVQRRIRTRTLGLHVIQPHEDEDDGEGQGISLTAELVLHLQRPPQVLKVCFLGAGHPVRKVPRDSSGTFPSCVTIDRAMRIAEFLADGATEEIALPSRRRWVVLRNF
jgi:hypothetical protein